MYKWNYKYHNIGLVFQDQVVRVKNDAALRDFLKADKKNAARLASFCLKAYEYKFKKPLRITKQSLTTEIQWHFMIQEGFLKKDGLVGEILYDTAARRLTDWMLNHMDVIDCGEKEIDNNRFLWDLISARPYEH